MIDYDNILKHPLAKIYPSHTEHLINTAERFGINLNYEDYVKLITIHDDYENNK